MAKLSNRKRTGAKAAAKSRPKKRARKKTNSNASPKSKAPRNGRTKAKLKNSSLPSGTAFQLAFKLLRKGRSQKRSAELAGISTKRFRRYLRGNKLARFRKGKWQIKDRRPRSVRIFTQGQQRTIRVQGFRPASLAMKHRAAVRRFLESNDESELAPFRGLSVTDVSKQKHSLETRPNVLYRLANVGSDADMKVYRLID